MSRYSGIVPAFPFTCQWHQAKNVRRRKPLSLSPAAFGFWPRRLAVAICALKKLVDCLGAELERALYPSMCPISPPRPFQRLVRPGTPNLLVLISPRRLCHVFMQTVSLFLPFPGAVRLSGSRARPRGSGTAPCPRLRTRASACGASRLSGTATLLGARLRFPRPFRGFGNVPLSPPAAERAPAFPVSSTHAAGGGTSPMHFSYGGGEGVFPRPASRAAGGNPVTNKRRAGCSRFPLIILLIGGSRHDSAFIPQRFVEQSASPRSFRTCPVHAASARRLESTLFADRRRHHPGDLLPLAEKWQGLLRAHGVQHLHPPPVAGGVDQAVPGWRADVGAASFTTHRPQQMS